MLASAVVVSGIPCEAQDRAQESMTLTNPAITTTLCRFALALPEMEGPLTLGIFSPEGNLIRLLYRDTAIDSIPAGLNGLLISWDGKDEAGVEVPPGIYHARGIVHGKIWYASANDAFPVWLSMHALQEKDLRSSLMQNLFPENRIAVLAARDALQERRPMLSISAQSGRGKVVLMADGLPIFEIETQHDRPLIFENPEIELHAENRAGTARLTLFFADRKESYQIFGLDQLVPLDAGALPMPPEKH